MNLYKITTNTFFRRIAFSGIVLMLLNIAFFILIGKGFGGMSRNIQRWEVIKNNFTEPGWDFVFINVFLMITVYAVIWLNDTYWKPRLNSNLTDRDKLILFLSNFISVYLLLSCIFLMSLFGLQDRDMIFVDIFRIDYSILAGLGSVLLVEVRRKSDPIITILKYFGMFFVVLLLFNLLRVGIYGEFKNVGLKDNFEYKVNWDTAFEMLALYPLFGIGFLGILEVIFKRIESDYSNESEKMNIDTNSKSENQLN